MEDSIPFFINIEKEYTILDNNLFQVDSFQNTAKKVSEFYSDNPFPNYQDFETINDLANKLESNLFLKNFKKQIGFGKKILEVGSGTCQLSIMLSHNTNNRVVAMDSTIDSIKLGREFAKKNKLKNCTFLHADIFNNPIKKKSFDIIWCSGVLHHTDNPAEGFNIISEWLKKEGIIVLGLYNKYGRLRTRLRQKIFNICKENLGTKIITRLDPILKKNISTSKKYAWINDQYKHPVESYHTLDEVLKWFDSNNIEYISSIPNTQLFRNNYKDILKISSKGNIFSRIIQQFLMLFNNLGDEGGLFIVIGRKI